MNGTNEPSQSALLLLLAMPGNRPYYNAPAAVNLRGFASRTVNREEEAALRR
jgi:hypothetical protein